VDAISERGLLDSDYVNLKLLEVANSMIYIKVVPSKTNCYAKTSDVNPQFFGRNA
jgi:hypothetical protein